MELRADGEDGCELTPKREQVARQVAMSSEDDMVALLDALLEADLG